MRSSLLASINLAVMFLGWILLSGAIAPLRRTQLRNMTARLMLARRLLLIVNGFRIDHSEARRNVVGSEGGTTILSSTHDEDVSRDKKPQERPEQAGSQRPTFRDKPVGGFGAGHSGRNEIRFRSGKLYSRGRSDDAAARYGEDSWDP